MGIRMSYSDAAIAMTKSFEGLRLRTYTDVAGIRTIGYGHVGPEAIEGCEITEEQADRILRSDLGSAIKCVNDAVRVSLTQGQFDALVDFCFNTGRGNFLGSSLLRLVNRDEFSNAAAQFGLWVHAGGRVIPGLVRRRAAEAALFAGSEFNSAEEVAKSSKQNPHRSTDVAVAVPGSALALPGNGR